MEGEAGEVQTRRRILRAARALFAERGFASTTTRAIAQEAGCNLSMINYYYGSKDGLMEAVLRDFVDGLGHQLAAQAEDSEPRAVIERLVNSIVDFVSDNRDMYELIVRDIILVRNHPLHELVRGLVQKNALRASRFLRRAMVAREPGVHPPGLTPEFALLFLMGMVIPALVFSPLVAGVVGGGVQREQLKRAVVQVLSSGVLGQEFSEGVAR